MVSPAGAGPCPQITCVFPTRRSWTRIGASPPGPFRWGSTTCKAKAVATPASKALPPRSSVAIPTAVAIQCVEATTPNVPWISGRVVNGAGLMKPIYGFSCAPKVLEPAKLAEGGPARQSRRMLAISRGVLLSPPRRPPLGGGREETIDETCAADRHYRTRWGLSLGIPAVEGLRGHRHYPALLA